MGTGNHPYYDWLNTDAPDGVDYLPGDVQAYIPLARVWAYSYQTAFDDEHPLSSAANNFLVYYGEQRQRDQRVRLAPPASSRTADYWLTCGVE
jgi:hypothetical protein